MAKVKTQFVCQACGNISNRWAGKCEACGEWNTIIEDDPVAGIGGGPASLRSPRKGRAVTLTK
ncbi:DNA repair protein RadA, partial [Salmonella enterica subsp. enterica]|nr:DNA repair protein RadA [Salmonella enterica subsp. enterica serovar Enteritidis]